MERAEYEFLVQKLNSQDDIERLKTQHEYSEGLLYNVLSRKIVRNTLRDYYRVKRHENQLAQEWRRGKPILRLARELDFPPVLLASFILQKVGYSKKAFRQSLVNPDSEKNVRVKHELVEVNKADFIYSPWAFDLQTKNGQEAEIKIGEWLDAHKINFLSQDENKQLGFHFRTPDFLLENPLDVNGKKIHWIESKASFGDDREIKKDHKKQLQPYTEHFGPGMVVYWYGFIDDIKLDDNIILASSEFFGKKAHKKQA